MTAVTIRVDKIRIENASAHIEPFISCQLRDAGGFEIQHGGMQDTPPSTELDAEYIYFNSEIHMQLCLEQMPEGAAIFLELKHYKMKKSKAYVSTKCYCFLELGKLVTSPPGGVLLEIYAKPTSFKRTRLKPFGGPRWRTHYMIVSIACTEDGVGAPPPGDQSF